MPIPSYIYRDYSGQAIPTGLAAAMNNTDLTFTVTDVSSWLNLDGYPIGTGSTGVPGGPGSGPFVVAVAYGTANEEKILCSGINTATNVVTVWSSGSLTGRGYDGTTALAHAAGDVAVPVFSATEADEANNVAYKVLGKITGAGQLIVGAGVADTTMLPAGTSGYFLSSNGVGSALSWKRTPTLSTYAATAPSSPAAGDIWYDTNTTDLKVYTGAAWVGVSESPNPYIRVRLAADVTGVTGWQRVQFDTNADSKGATGDIPTLATSGANKGTITIQKNGLYAIGYGCSYSKATNSTYIGGGIVAGGIAYNASGTSLVNALANGWAGGAVTVPLQSGDTVACYSYSTSTDTDTKLLGSYSATAGSGKSYMTLAYVGNYA